MLKLQLYHEMYHIPTPSLAELDAALQNNVGDAQTYYLRGVANFQDFEFRAAADDFNRAVELVPDFVDAIFHRGLVHVVRGHYDDALEDLNRVIALKPDHAAAYYNRGRLYYWKGESEAAIADFQQARKLDPLLGRELNLRYIIGKIERGLEDESVLGQVQSIIDRLMDL
jgi:tetratricopeptide (TPR) repeat protein